MPGKMALVDCNKCSPVQCEGGVCKTSFECPLKLIKQEASYETPMTDPFQCKGCGMCVRACVRRAMP